MQIEALVTDLETSKQLQEAGIKYDTAFVWGYSGLNRKWYVSLRTQNAVNHIHIFDKIIPAFTAGEMMQVLPAMIKKHNIYYHFNFAKIGKHYDIRYSTSTNDKFLILITENKFIDALAKLCLWCRKEGYL